MSEIKVGSIVRLSACGERHFGNISNRDPYGIVVKVARRPPYRDGAAIYLIKNYKTKGNFFESDTSPNEKYWHSDYIELVSSETLHLEAIDLLAL
jgi:hypothetical protein